MKKIAYIAAASMLAMATAYAGGQTMEPVASGPHWTGFYLGGDAGYMWGKAKESQVYSFYSPASERVDINYHPNGGIIAMHGGYQYLWARHYLTGLEVLTGWAGLSGKQQMSTLINDPTRVDNSIAHTKGGLFVGLLGRLGLVEWKNWLFYGKGGYAWTDISQTFTDSNGNGGALLLNPSEPTRNAALYGGGIEYAVNDSSWSVLAEYLRWDFGGSKESKAESNTGSTYYFKHYLTANSFTLGASYHFA